MKTVVQDGQVAALLYLQVESFVNLAEAAFAEQHEKQVPLVEDGMIVEPTLILVVDPLQFSYVQVAFSFELLHFQLQITVFLLQRVLLQLFNTKSKRYVTTNHHKRRD